MAKYRVYLKIAKARRARLGFLVEALKQPSPSPIQNKPTICIALDLDIDDKEFMPDRILIEKKIESPEHNVSVEQLTPIQKFFDEVAG